jgi:hypothetical protein
LDNKILSEYGTEVVAHHRRGRRVENKTPNHTATAGRSKNANCSISFSSG